MTETNSESIWRKIARKAFMIGVIPILWVVAILNGHQFEQQYAVEVASRDLLYAAQIVCDSDGRIVYCNKQAEEYTGYTKEELVIGGVTILIPPELERVHTSQFLRAMKDEANYGKSKIFRSKFYAKNKGDAKTAVFKTTVFNVNGKVYAHSLILPDFILKELESAPEFVLHDDAPNDTEIVTNTDASAIPTN